MENAYTRQPPRGAKVAGGSPLGKGVTAHFLFNGDFRSSVRGKSGNPIVAGTVPFVTRPDGRYASSIVGGNINGTGSGYVNTNLLPSVLGVTGAAPRTIIVEFELTDSNAMRNLFSFGDASATTRSMNALQINSNYREIRFDTYSNDTTYIPHTIGGTSARVFLAISYDGGTGLTFRSWSRLASTGAVVFNTKSITLAGPLNTGDAAPLHFLGGGAYNWAPAASILYHFSLYGGRCLTPAEIDRVYADRHQVMAPAQTFPYAAMSANSIPADTSLAGAAVAGASVTGGLATSIKMRGAAGAVAAASGMLVTGIPLAGVALVQASAAGALATPSSGLSGIARGEAAASGALSTAIRLAGAGAARATGAGALTARITMAGAARTAASAVGTLGTAAPAPKFDISKISPSRIVVFEGSGSRIVTFEGSGPRMRIAEMSLKMPTKDGERWVVDRDPDEESWYGAEITAELRDRTTTAKSVELVLVGVVQLAEPVIQVVTIDDVSRTFVAAFLGGLDEVPPEGWKWAARVRCANGERFDKTTHFNEVDP
jgi:hypothetical protein